MFMPLYLLLAASTITSLPVHVSLITYHLGLELDPDALASVRCFHQQHVCLLFCHSCRLSKMSLTGDSKDDSVIVETDFNEDKASFECLLSLSLHNSDQHSCSGETLQLPFSMRDLLFFYAGASCGSCRGAWCSLEVEREQLADRWYKSSTRWAGCADRHS